eukprot:8411928-Pyramimonas_sp.AAC.1
MVALKLLNLDGNPLSAPATVADAPGEGPPLVEIWAKSPPHPERRTAAMLAHLRALLPAEEQARIESRALVRRRKEASRVLASAREYACADTLRAAVSPSCPPPGPLRPPG